ncbi:hypothetical protein LMIY3S_04670 [Labrys miyagiensis]
MTEDLIHKIREKARELWQLEGCPEGRELLHWDMARELVTQENTAEFTLVPNAPEGNDIVDAVAALDNLREVPDLSHKDEPSGPAPDIDPGRPKRVAGGRF